MDCHMSQSRVSPKKNESSTTLDRTDVLMLVESNGMSEI